MTKAERQAEKERALTAARLREVLHYDPNTGVFRWRTGGRGRRQGAIAGRFSGAGYRQLLIDGMYFYAHRLAWLYVTGEWPVCQIDHKDLNKANNRFENFRLADRVQNQGNRAANTGSQSGVKGVRYLPKTGTWQARISINSKSRHLGNFALRADAESAYAAAAKIHFGTFSRAA